MATKNSITALTYPPEWKFEPEGDEVPAGVLKDVYAYAGQIARGAPSEKDVVETFKARFGDSTSSSSLSFAWGDLDSALEAAKENGATFAESLYFAVKELEGEGLNVPTIEQINRMFLKHRFFYEIAPPNLLKREGHPSWRPPAPPTPSGSHTAAGSCKPTTPAAVPPTPAPAPAPVAPKSAPTAKPSAERTCFVAQPFSRDFQGRFTEELQPAIEAAGLRAYKVDNDPAADILIEDIERGIREASIVLADITEPNPNVWFELGFAEAAGRPLVMICCEERPTKEFPFDIRHRKVIVYAKGTRGDLDKLRSEVTTRIKALLTKEAERAKKAPAHVSSPPVSAAPALDQRTMAALMAILGASSIPKEWVATGGIVDGMRKRGDYTQADANLGVRVLLRKGLIEPGTDQDDFGQPYPTVRLTDEGEDFVLQHHLTLDTKETRGGGYGGYGGYGTAPKATTPDDDIPF